MQHGNFETVIVLNAFMKRSGVGTFRVSRTRVLQAGGSRFGSPCVNFFAACFSGNFKYLQFTIRSWPQVINTPEPVLFSSVDCYGVFFITSECMYFSLRHWPAVRPAGFEKLLSLTLFSEISHSEPTVVGLALFSGSRTRKSVDVILLFLQNSKFGGSKL